MLPLPLFKYSDISRLIEIMIDTGMATAIDSDEFAI